MKITSKRFVLFSMSLILISLLLLLGIACVQVKEPPSPTTPPPSQPQGNRPPIISNLTAANMQLYPSGNTEIQVVSADPDGDKVSISWQATGGNINGAGYVVTWQAPKQYGSFTITAIASDGKGGSAQQSVTISVGANQSPQVTSLNAKPPLIGLGGASTISCVAIDPDGDVISYTWKADEGNVTGVGPTVTWYAPNKEGNFNVIVKVSDNKGGETQGNVVITVAGATKTVMLSLLREETGTVGYDGNRDNSRMRAGDDEKDIGHRAFFTYNIFQLNRSEVKDAKLLFTTRSVVGNPFIVAMNQSLNGLMLGKVSFSGQLPSFNIIPSALQKAGAAMFDPPAVIDVTPELVTLVNAGADRFQFMAYFGKIQNANVTAEWIEWTDVKLQIVYTEK